MTDTTATALLDAAEVAFAEHGVDDVSLRSIMRSIGANPAAVHYHYGSRQTLAAAVLDRVLEPLQRRRRDLLDSLVVDAPPSVEQLLDALIRPDLEAVAALYARNPEGVRLIGTIYGRPSEFVQSQVEASFRPVAARFMPLFAAALPAVLESELAWRIRWFVFGPLGALLSDAAVSDVASDPEAHLSRLVSTMSGALRATEEVPA